MNSVYGSLQSQRIEKARSTLKRAIPSADQYLEAGNIEILSYRQWYFGDDVFDSTKVFQGFDLKITQALKKGYSRMRFLGDLAWLDQKYWKVFSDYERNIDEWFKDKPVSILCVYPTVTLNAVNILDVARTHRFIVAKRKGTWDILEAPELKNAKKESERFDSELDNQVEDKVKERTARLIRTNQALQAEIVEHKRSAEALLASEDRLQAAIDAVDIGLWEWDLVSGRIIWLGHHDRLFGFAPGEFDGTYRGFEKLVHPEDLEELNRVVQHAKEDGSAYAHEYRIIWPDGSIHWIAGQGRFINNEAGLPVRMRGVVLDVTERKRAEQAIRKSEQVLREAESLGHTGSWEHNLVTGEIFNTEENLRLFFGDDRSKGMPFDDYAQAVHPDDREFVLRSHAQLVAEGGPGDIEFRVVWPDGSVHVLFGRATVVRDELGHAIRVYGTNLDITEHKQVEEAVRENQQLIRLVLATLPVGVAVLDRAGNIVLVNDASKRIWGGMIASGRDRWAQTTGFWHDTGERIDQANWASERALSEGQTSLNELIDIETYDGQQKTIRNSAAPIRDAEGLIVGAVFVNEDVTERVRAEEETKHQTGRAETLARIAARLNRQLDLEAVVLAVCQEIVETFKVSQAVMNLYDKVSDRLVYAGGINIPPEYAAIMEPIPREQFEEFLRVMGPIMVVPDIQSLPDVPIAEFSIHLDVRTVVTAAMLRDEELIGVVALGVNGRIREFTKDELTLLQAISDQAAQALANAKLLKAANEQHEQLRALSTRLVETQETERRAIARELHDDVGQTLTGLMMQLGMVKSMLPKSAKSMHNTLEKSEALIQEILEHTRSIITDLRPQVLDDLGLVPALQRLGDDFQVNTAVKVEMNLARLPIRLPTQLEVTLFRIVQEALTNVRKHARANRVSIALSKEDELVVLSVQDDGLGFEKKITRSRANGDMVIQGGWMITAGHFGLIGIQERVTQLGGRLQISGASGHGTILRVELPLSEAKAVSDENL